MPCFHGLAVSIHTADGPLPEYSIQKQTRHHRITSYIPVPPPKVKEGSSSKIPEQSTFAISITLLTPGLSVPYSIPKPTPEDPYPRPKTVAGLPEYGGSRGKHAGQIAAYQPITTSPNETIAAYIYFDGRAKEEVATLLRRGEETWVNSRWVSIPESEGGGLAEKEFIFREVGLERWLNGLDLDGKDAAAKIERRRQKFEKKRKMKQEAIDSDEEADKKPLDKHSVLRYGDNKNAPVESLSGDDGVYSDDSDSDDDEPMPESAGQIKIALFRVLASGEVKKGEYSPQFDVHDDEEGQAADGSADIDHTTSFAKPKTLDPKSISTQTVTGIDPPNRPYAVFTFLYRGERQLQKMGILPSAQKAKNSPKRKSAQIDFSHLGPLSTAGTKNFAGYRDPTASHKRKNSRKVDIDAMDSDGDDDEDDDMKLPTTAEEPTLDNNLLSPDDALKQDKLTEGLKRQHSAEPLSANSPTPQTRKSSPTVSTPSDNGATLLDPSSALGSSVPSDLAQESIIGSPFKKQRSSLPGLDESVRKKLGLESDLRRGSEGLIGSGSNSIPEVPWTDGLKASSVPVPDSFVKTEMEEEI
ncbi:hypothetical protein EJ06DRAFT_480361 [Trichodelitschia bisporula]|uniref:DUF7918 domain-containing protein n=1 Tax=Trichodelitschia bisporula TaxID=703511 RepID=A0A6G1HQR5_9PEZI|nr:hypothetical protein EJ06DRAFT_480361 [Trichodelitschia bisporula]